MSNNTKESGEGMYSQIGSYHIFLDNKRDSLEGRLDKFRNIKWIRIKYSDSDEEDEIVNIE